MSTLTQSLIDEIKSAPEPAQREVLDFLVFLKTRQAKGRENLFPSAKMALAADWNILEEDAASRAF